MKKYLISFALSFLTYPIIAAPPSIWSVNTRAEILKGDSRGVSIDQNGTISPAPKLNEVFRTEQSYIWSSAVDSNGNIFLGTGGDGKIFKVDSSGKGALFTDLTELNVSAIVFGNSGEMYASTSPDGRVYKIDTAGKADIYFEPKEKYIWALAVMSDGSLAVGTGENGKIFRVKTAKATPESSLLFDTSETHVITLATDKKGFLYAGTDSSGLVMRFGPDGKPFGLLDSSLREIHHLAVGPDDSLYVLALGESVSTPKPTESSASSPSTSTESKTVSADKPGIATDGPAKSRYDLKDAKSAVYHILPDGATDVMWASPTVTAFSIYAHKTGNGVLIGTSDKGRIYDISNDGREKLVLQSDANQISTISQAGQNLIATSSNQGNLFRFGAETVTEGIYESAVLDAKSSATWGRIWWTATGNVTLQTRAGNTEKADETWSAWSQPATDQKGIQISSPKSQYFQFRAVLRGTAATTNLSEVNVAFIARNIAPEVLAINVLPTNVGLASNPPVPVDPNIEITGMDPATFGIPTTAIPPRRVFQRGATSLQWTAEDRNGDKLVYDVFFKESGDSSFKALRENMTDNFVVIDGQSLADGRYIFKVVAKDTGSNPASQALSGERLTSPIDIDNTPPVVTVTGSPQLAGERAKIIFSATDAASYLTRAEFSVNGGDWQSVYADDGISDSPRENYTLEIPAKAPGEYVVTLRVFDVNGNAGNARAVVKK